MYIIHVINIQYKHPETKLRCTHTLLSIPVHHVHKDHAFRISQESFSDKNNHKQWRRTQSHHMGHVHTYASMISRLINISISPSLTYVLEVPIYIPPVGTQRLDGPKRTQTSRDSKYGRYVIHINYILSIHTS